MTDPIEAIRCECGARDSGMRQCDECTVAEVRSDCQAQSGARWIAEYEVRAVLRALDTARASADSLAVRLRATEARRDEARADARREREHVEALQRCLGERAPDEPETYAQAVGAAMREGIASARDTARREAIEEAVGVAAGVMRSWQQGEADAAATGDHVLARYRHARFGTAEDIVFALRALLAPRSDEPAGERRVPIEAWERLRTCARIVLDLHARTHPALDALEAAIRETE